MIIPKGGFLSQANPPFRFFATPSFMFHQHGHFPGITDRSPPAREGGDVSTTLNYTMPPEREGLKPIDADLPEAERRNAQRGGLTDV